MLNPLIVNLELGLYGLLFAAVFLYVHRKISEVRKGYCGEMQKDWVKAISAHADLLKEIHHRLANLSMETAAPAIRQDVACGDFRLAKPGCIDGPARHRGFGDCQYLRPSGRGSRRAAGNVTFAESGDLKS
jgi:hypothetical protein